MNIFNYGWHGDKLAITGLREDVIDTSIVIPETIDGIPVVEIATYAFKDTKLTDVLIGENITEVGSEAFSNCHCLKSVTWNAHCEIPGMCFYNCTSLSKFDFSNVPMIDSNAFRGSGLKEILLPENIKWIGEYAFSLCKRLEKVTWNCFYGCIPDFCFAQCFELKHYDFTNVWKIGAGAFCKSNLQELYLPRNIKEIEDNAFAECVNLKQVHWNCDCNQIPALCFYADSSLHYFDFANVKKFRPMHFRAAG